MCLRVSACVCVRYLFLFLRESLGQSSCGSRTMITWMRRKGKRKNRVEEEDVEEPKPCRQEQIFSTEFQPLFVKLFLLLLLYTVVLLLLSIFISLPSSSSFFSVIFVVSRFVIICS